MHKDKSPEPLGAEDIWGVCTHLQSLLHGPQSPAYERICGQNRRRPSAFFSVADLKKDSGHFCEKKHEAQMQPFSRKQTLSLWERERKPCHHQGKDTDTL